MRKSHLLLSLAAVSLLAAPSSAMAKAIFALPIAPGGPGLGPWIVAPWPDDDCRDCAQNPRDKAAMVKARDAILSGRFGDVDFSNATIHLLPERPFGPDTPTATAAQLHALLEGCAVGSQGMLKRGASTGPGTSYGVGLDCPNDKNRRWLSISLVDGRVSHIYYLPRDPIWVVDTAG